VEIKDKIIYVSLITATLFGIFGQDIAYFLNEYFIKSYPIYYLTALTVISMFLYISSMLFIFIQYKMQKQTKNALEIASVIFLIGFPVSCWSLFVTAMWWG
jgi:hypothetical protein